MVLCAHSGLGTKADKPKEVNLLPSSSPLLLPLTSIQLNSLFRQARTTQSTTGTHRSTLEQRPHSHKPSSTLLDFPSPPHQNTLFTPSCLARIPPLPVELLSHVLDLATSPSYALSARNDDRKLLRHCCLVSKQLCAIAQPKLWSVLSSKGDFPSIARFPQQAQHIRVLDYSTGFEMADLDNAVSMLPDLQDSRVGGRYLARLDFGTFHSLVHLTLYCVEIPSSSAATFPNLVSLTLNMVHLVPEAPHTAFLAASFPALRALHTQMCYDAHTRNQIFLEPNDLPPGQLEIIQVDVADVTVFPADLHGRGVVVVLAFELSYAYWVTRHGSFSDFQHLLVQPTTSDVPHAGTHLRELATTITTRKTTLSLSLPGTLSLHAPLSSHATGARDRLLDLCSTRNIDVIWRPYSKIREDDVAVSKDFWEYARDCKRKKAREAAVASQ